MTTPLTDATPIPSRFEIEEVEPKTGLGWTIVGWASLGYAYHYFVKYYIDSAATPLPYVLHCVSTCVMVHILEKVYEVGVNALGDRPSNNSPIQGNLVARVLRSGVWKVVEAGEAVIRKIDRIFSKAVGIRPWDEVKYATLVDGDNYSNWEGIRNVFARQVVETGIWAISYATNTFLVTSVLGYPLVLGYFIMPTLVSGALWYFAYGLLMKNQKVHDKYEERLIERQDIIDSDQLLEAISLPREPLTNGNPQDLKEKSEDLIQIWQPKASDQLYENHEKNIANASNPEYKEIEIDDWKPKFFDKNRQPLDHDPDPEIIDYDPEPVAEQVAQAV